MRYRFAGSLLVLATMTVLGVLGLPTATAGQNTSSSPAASTETDSADCAYLRMVPHDTEIDPDFNIQPPLLSSDEEPNPDRNRTDPQGVDDCHPLEPREPRYVDVPSDP